MTRTRTGDYKDPTNAPRERRQSRNGLGDPRAIPKKAGAGNGNWGVLGVEVKDLEQDSFTGAASSSPVENKISVTDAKTFSFLQGNSGQANNDNNAAASNGSSTVEQASNGNASSSNSAK
ncbi:hypothetical protein EMPS_09186 [Entomortierella parvispora]|uniref:Hyaluronan/mRNA-binding protein domain-containing protein n=1 Tax=Entomortierella parvispora TaxID=205924 RepID=A0A9P3HHQ1_9FUNG|nr:hypothetical protein EMPS_09186 [Entomortierella parvispora]